MNKLRWIYISTFFACTLLLNSGTYAALVKYSYTGSVFTDVTGTAYRWMDWCKRVGGSCSNSDTVVNRPSIYNNVATNELTGVWSGPAAYIPLPATAWLFLTALGSVLGLKHHARIA